MQTAKDSVGGAEAGVKWMYFVLRHTLLWIPLVFGILSLILVAVWASRDEVSFLGVADWETNIFPWHPVLMVAGFYFSQVLAILSWHCDWFPTPASGLFSWQRFFHVFWNCAAMATLISGLYAVFKYRANIQRSDLSTIHEWTGILIATLFLIQFLLGIIFSSWRTNVLFNAATRHTSSADIAKTLTTISQIRKFHKFLGISVFLLTSMNIFSGIVQRQLTCWFPERYDTTADYGGLDEGCRISNGLGVVVWFTTVGTILVLATRYTVKPKDLGATGTSEAVVDHRIINTNREKTPKLYSNISKRGLYAADASPPLQQDGGGDGVEMGRVRRNTIEDHDGDGTHRAYGLGEAPAGDGNGNGNGHGESKEEFARVAI